eukprot:1196091-Prorocentrum_minimum.AAC.3
MKHVCYFEALRCVQQIGSPTHMKHVCYFEKIFVTSFNQFKKALTYDTICAKVHPHRERVLVVADEVDDFLDRDKLVRFNSYPYPRALQPYKPYKP